MQNKMTDRPQPSTMSDKCPELTVRTFFEFMRTAYQVNDSFEDLASILTANSEIDWTELAKIDLNLQPNNGLEKKDDEATVSNRQDKGTGTNEEKICFFPRSISNVENNANQNNCPRESRENSSPKKSQTPLSGIEGKPQTTDPLDLDEPKTPVTNPCNPQETQSPLKKCKSLNLENHNEIKEHPLGKCMKKNLSDILHEGLLDSVLPYMLPKPAHSQPIIKKPMTSAEPKKSASLGSHVEGKGPNAVSATRDRDKSKQQKKSAESEVEIHVCDEAKNLKKDFRCPQKLLISKMRYFADVTAGQKLDEMDISVHCDIVIFDWLMRWVKKDIIKKSEWPILEASNVIPIMVSASFLQMEPLLEHCLVFCHENMSEVLKTSTILTCLNDNLFTRLADLFTNSEVELLKDRKDKIQSRLFCKLIVSLVDLTPNNARGHYSSLATLFKCGKCGKIVIRSISDSVACIPSSMRLDTRGNVHSKHTRDLNWTLNDYIVTLRSELRSWRKVYWRLWGDCHYIYCRECETYFPINQMDWCSYHSEVPQFFANEQQRTSPFPLGRYPCCSQRAYRFETLPNKQGCRFKEHIPGTVSGYEADILTIFSTYRDVISIDPPQLFFPENITRLVARDPSLQPGKLCCKETMWWDGIELVPPRPKLGLLGKIWGGSGVRRPCQPSDSQRSSRKLRPQGSQLTDPSSACSSATESDDDDGATGCGESTVDEDSENSEESHVWPNSKRTNKFKKNSRFYAPKRSDGGRCWSATLLARYNQDNQRDYEEKASAQMIALLTKRTAIESSLFPKSIKQQSQNWNNQSIGGTYVRLEAEFRDQSTQSHKCKNSTHVKGSGRARSSRIT
ncbi:uncharacterized protein KIAA1841 homolog isoform X2 [Venturia canescens]|nr:uncharacterized protein KIAA1841 homolog isoform X2 [Venturia canescens]XP_043267742.1 uncharacterized protein KIAA1841 homolog isoform X2 [Venturia canescens]